MNLFRSTTAIVMVASLGASGPVFGQGQGQGNAKGLAKQLARDLSIETCEDVGEVPCVTEDAAVLLRAPAGAEDLPACEAEGALPCLTADGQVKADPESPLTLELLAMALADQPADGATPAEGDAPALSAETAEPEAAPEPEEEATAEAETETAEEPETAEATTEGADTAVAEDTAESADGTEQLAEDENAVEAEAEQTAEADAAAEPEGDDAAESEQIAEGEGAVEAGAAPDGEEAQIADDVTESGDGTEQLAEGENAVEAEAEETAEAETTEEATVEESAETEAVAEVEEAPAAAAAAEADDGEVAAEAEVETEEVTEETARSATEDFETSASGDASASTASGDDDGLSNFEKALILGLGAVAVGSILDSGDEVVSNSGDRVVLKNQVGSLRVLKDDDALLRQPGSEIRTETFNDGSTRTTVTRDDGTRIVTIRAADGRVVRRARVFEDGSQVVLFDDTETVEPVVVSELPNVEERTLSVDVTDEDALRAALAREEQRLLDRRFSLRQIRQIREVRELAPEIELDAITFASGSAAIQPSQAEELSALGRTMLRLIEERPGEVFLIEGHTDAVGAESYNLALSDRRAETVALALTEYFDVPPENMITQGYGESQLKIDTQADERLNRRAVVRRITPLLRMAER